MRQRPAVLPTGRGIEDISSVQPYSLTRLSIWATTWHDKTNKMSVRPAKTQISLGIRPVWSETSLCTQWVAKDPRFLHADSEDSDQTGRMPRLIWVFTGPTVILFVLSCRGSYFSLGRRQGWKTVDWTTEMLKNRLNKIRSAI